MTFDDVITVLSIMSFGSAALILVVYFFIIKKKR